MPPALATVSEDLNAERKWCNVGWDFNGDLWEEYTGMSQRAAAALLIQKKPSNEDNISRQGTTAAIRHTEKAGKQHQRLANRCSH